MRQLRGVMERHRAHVGFTLVELIAAVALLVILLGILFVVFGEAGRTVSIGKDRLERYRTVRAAFRLLEEDITNAFLISEGGNTYGFYYDDSGSAAGDGLDPAFLTGAPDSDRLSLIRLRRGYDASDPEPGFMEVCYFRHTYPANQGIVSRQRNYLFRATDEEEGWTIGSALPLGFTVPEPDDSGNEAYCRNRILALGVSDLQFRYMATGDSDWEDDWDASTDGLPRAVEVTIRLGPDSSTDPADHETFTHVIFLPMAP